MTMRARTPNDVSETLATEAPFSDVAKCACSLCAASAVPVSFARGRAGRDACAHIPPRRAVPHAGCYGINFRISRRADPLRRNTNDSGLGDDMETSPLRWLAASARSSDRRPPPVATFIHLSAGGLSAHFSSLAPTETRCVVLCCRHCYPVFSACVRRSARTAAAERLKVVLLPTHTRSDIAGQFSNGRLYMYRLSPVKRT
jgi:hypothetical protein